MMVFTAVNVNTYHPFTNKLSWVAVEDFRNDNVCSLMIRQAHQDRFVWAYLRYANLLHKQITIRL